MIIPCNNEDKERFKKAAHEICVQSDVHCMLIVDAYPLEMKFIGKTANMITIVRVDNGYLMPKNVAIEATCVWEGKK